MYIALRPVNIAGRTYRVGESVPDRDVLAPSQLINAGVLCQVPDPPAEPDLPAEPDPAEAKGEPMEEFKEEPAPKSAKKAKAAKEAAHV